MKTRRSDNQRRIVLALAVLPMMLGSNVNATVSFDMKVVGNAGNAADTLVNSDGTSGHGSVNYTYAVASKSVTNAQYVEFLNKVDPNGTNSLQLWEARMSSWPYNPSTGVGGSAYEGGIDLNTGAAAGSKYSVRAGRANFPAMFITWSSSARFVNWLANGQGSGGTESGVYTAPPLYPGSWQPTVQPSRAAGAKYFLPSEDEFYKAAYYDPTLNGGTGGYYLWGTRSNTAPTGAAPGTGTNIANVRKADGTFWQSGQPFSPTYPTYMVDVGSYANTQSYYGLLDAEGEVYSWTETFKSIGGTTLFPIYKGGTYYYDVSTHSGAATRLIYSFGNVATYALFGFRIAGLQTDGGWNVNAAGNWTVTGNWSGAAPSLPGSVATFGPIITAPRTVSVDANRTVGSLVFNSAQKYTLAGSSTITIDIDTALTGSVNVLAGSHDITAPLAINRNSTFTITNAASTLKLTNLQTTTNSITKSGAGTLEVNQIKANGLTINAGKVVVSATGSPISAASELNSLSVTGSAQLDIKNNALVLHSSDTTNAARDARWAQVVTGQNNFDNNGQVTWDGPGIVSSSARTNNVALGVDALVIGVANNHDLAKLSADGGAILPYDNTNPWLGTVTNVGANDVLIRMTYAGDTNLDGAITIDDYNNIDGTFSGLLPTNYGWVSGDFDFNGAITIDDYNAIDSGFLYQGGQLTQALIDQRLAMFGPNYVAHLEAVAAAFASVPEPTAISLLTVATASLWARKRRRAS